MKNTGIKLNKMQVNAIASEVQTKINTLKMEKATKAIEKDSKYKEFVKVTLEYDALQKKVAELSKKTYALQQELQAKSGYNFNYIKKDNKIVINSVWNYNNNKSYPNLTNEIIMMTIDPENNIQSIMDQLVKKFVD
jgi:hypothetical protein